jgi:hypothetical protein
MTQSFPRSSQSLSTPHLDPSLLSPFSSGGWSSSFLILSWFCFSRLASSSAFSLLSEGSPSSTTSASWFIRCASSSNGRSAETSSTTSSPKTRARTTTSLSHQQPMDLITLILAKPVQARAPSRRGRTRRRLLNPRRPPVAVHRCTRRWMAQTHRRTSLGDSPSPRTDDLTARASPSPERTRRAGSVLPTAPSSTITSSSDRSRALACVRERRRLRKCGQGRRTGRLSTSASQGESSNLPSMRLLRMILTSGSCYLPASPLRSRTRATRREV